VIYFTSKQFLKLYEQTDFNIRIVIDEKVHEKSSRENKYDKSIKHNFIKEITKSPLINRLGNLNDIWLIWS
jgi:hypothetical protein